MDEDGDDSLSRNDLKIFYSKVLFNSQYAGGAERNTISMQITKTTVLPDEIIDEIINNVVDQNQRLTYPDFKKIITDEDVSSIMNLNFVY